MFKKQAKNNPDKCWLGSISVGNRQTNYIDFCGCPLSLYMIN